MLRPSHLDNVPDDEILDPRPRIFIREVENTDNSDQLIDKKYKIYPTPDSLFKRISTELANIVSLLDSVAKWSLPEDERPKNVSIASFAPVVPQILDILWPNATLIISTCLRIDQKEVAEDWFPDEKLEALQAIMKANRVDLLLKKLTTMSAGILPLPGAIVAENLPEATSEQQLSASLLESSQEISTISQSISRESPVEKPRKPKR